uniref:Secoisolariciresinol dehydrogenase 10 n=1 Tax=Kadsura heteroclita TaxID=124781 RepID=A0A7U3W1F9_9MAGN|nr:secoisolariciresinol dehydrogenase 4 [Kadsura heteroclita]QQM18975.1 secoisolariciresinol dehydrogenase 10 [Kadsura heteroclita]QQM18978.1 secoisolariciresinol dehydrogenase 13 [Kadsura heteroclita]QQM18984.1 secoisolariciresinol dehydrogenase 19 [Kadsura heteroclita]
MVTSLNHHGLITRRLEGKVAIITGGASGIGASTARLFQQHGAKVVIADIQDELAHALCQDLGPDVTYARCDVSNEDDVRNTVDHVVATHGTLDIMFNNAGITGSVNTSIREMEKENMEKVLSINVVGAFLGAKHAARVMVPARKGSILFTSSVASLICVTPTHAYTASKHAVVGLTKSLGVELGQFGIRVNCISPYGVATPMTKKGSSMEEEFEELIARTANLKGVVVKAEDIAQAALFLASEESKYISGLNLVIDGGFSTVNPSLAILLDQGKA